MADGWVDNLLLWVARSAIRLSGRESREKSLAGFRGGRGPMGWAVGWSQNRHAQVQHYRHWVYVGIRAIAQEIASAVPNVALVDHPEEEQDPTEVRRQKFLTRKSLQRFGEHERVTPVRWDHPVARLLADPNGPETKSEFWFAWAVHYKLTGIAYIWARPHPLTLGGKRLVQDLWVLPSQWTRPMPGKDKPIGHYLVQPYGATGGSIEIPEEDVIAFKDPNPLFPLDAWSGLAAGSEWIDIEEAMSTAQWSHFKQGIHPGFHLELPGGVDPDDPELDQIYAKLLQRFQGEANFHAPIITTNGSKLNPIGLTTPLEMAYLESGDQSRDRILALLGVPKGVVGIEPAGDNISAYAPLRQFCRFTIKPILSHLGETLTERLGRRYDERMGIWYDDPTPDDPEEIRKNIDSRIKGCAISPNEIRAQYGEEPWDPGVFPDGDKPVPQGKQQQVGGEQPGQDTLPLPANNGSDRLAASHNRGKR